MNGAVVSTDEELSALCTEWQARLRLLDWSVTARLASAADLDGNAGECNYDLNSQSAVISVISESDYRQSELWGPYSSEEILVHELLHLHVAGFSSAGGDRIAQIAEERAINAIAFGLVVAKYVDAPRQDPAAGPQLVE